MSIDFRNTNTVWASILVETLQRLGLTTAIICPGSRSTALAVAFAQHPHIEALPILDERSAAFFALGIAKKSGLPVAIACTSGTAGANFYPAIIEAHESRVPLLIFTADRPPELRECHSGQTIDQVKLYGHYPNWQAELATPSLELGMLDYLRQTLIYAWERSHFPTPGPVHLNLPFRDPLAPIPEPQIEIQTRLKQLATELNSTDFFAGISSPQPLTIQSLESRELLTQWQQCDRGLIIAGVAQPTEPKRYCEAIAHLAKTLNWPVLAEGLSPVRNHAQLNPYLISTYDCLLRNSQIANQLKPEMVIQMGDLPTSKELRTWLQKARSLHWIIDPTHHNLDPLHTHTKHLRLSIETFHPSRATLPPAHSTSAQQHYLNLWLSAEAQTRNNIDQTMAVIDALIEPKLAWFLSQILPAKTLLFIANSMPVRDVEFFWQPNCNQIQPFFNRGANGIDGTLSTALGMAHRHQSSVMLTGDLALLHDTNGFLINNKFQGHLTILLINNHGGGIFEMLPISQFDPPFEEFFATPQTVNFSQLCASYNVDYEKITTWEQLKNRLNPLPTTGIRVLELRCDRKVDPQWRKENLSKFAAATLLEP